MEKDDLSPEEAEQAGAEFEKVLAINPRYSDAYLSYSNLLVMRNRSDDAYKLLQRARQSGVEDPDVETKIGLLEMTKGEATGAKSAFERAVALHPRASMALEGLGRIAYAQGDYYLAAHYYARAFESLPSAHLAKTLGSIFLHELDDVRSALRAYHMALDRTSPDDPDYQRLQELISSLEEIK